jgi:hypothetical protein
VVSVPAAPPIGIAVSGTGSAVVAFGAPPSDGGAAISSYTVTAIDSTNPANGGETASGTASPLTVTGLTAGDTYTFTVTATNAAGAGPPSANSLPIVPN